MLGTNGGVHVHEVMGANEYMHVLRSPDPSGIGTVTSNASYVGMKDET